MKKILTIGLLLCGTSAMACPQMEGTFLCTSNDEGVVEKIVIQFSTAQKNGVNVYTANSPDLGQSLELIADGVERKSDFGSDDMSTTYTVATCAGNQLFITDREVAHSSDVMAGTHKSVSTYSGDTMTTVMESSWADGSSEKSTDTCTRM